MWTSNAAQSENTGLLYSCLKQVTIYYTSFSLGQQEPRLDFVDASFLQGLVNCTNFIKKKKNTYLQNAILYAAHLEVK